MTFLFHKPLKVLAFSPFFILFVIFQSVFCKIETKNNRTLSPLNPIEKHVENNDFSILGEDSIPKRLSFIDIVEDDSLNRFFQFHNEAGEVVKTIKYGEYNDINPVYMMLKNALDKDVDSIPIIWKKSDKSTEQNTKIKNNLSSVEDALGRKVVGLENIDFIAVDPNFSGYILSDKNLIRINYATMLSSSSADDRAVLDLSSIEIFDSKGEIFFEKQFDLGIIDCATLSEDEQYLLVGYQKSQNFWEGEILGYSTLHHGLSMLRIKDGEIVGNFEQNFANNLNDSTLFQNGCYAMIYADGFFQVWLRGEKSKILKKILINPEDKKFYYKKYVGENIKQWELQPYQERIRSFNSPDGTDILTFFVVKEW